MLIEKFTKISDTSRTIVALSAVGIIALAIYNWVISPQTAYLHAAQQHEIVLTDSSNKSIVIKNKIKTREIEVTKLRDDMEKLQVKFFSPSKCRDFFGSLEGLLKQSQCDLVSLTFDELRSAKSSTAKDTEQSLIRSKTFRLRINGNYNSIKAFLQKLQQYPEEITIVEMNITTVNKDSDVLACEIALEIYILEDMENNTNE